MKQPQAALPQTLSLARRVRGLPRAAVGPTLRTMRPQSLLHSRAAWVAAGLLALAGGVAYLVIGGTLWWWLGLAAVMPLVVLMIGRLSEDDDPWPPATGGDGPWGAP
jgi:hypothetical protein